MTPPDRDWRARLRTPPAFDAEALWDGVQARRGRRRRLRWALWVAPALLGATALALMAIRAGAPEELHRVDGGSLTHLEAGAAAARFVLSDGSQLELSPGASLWTRRLTPQHFTTEIARGDVTFDVVPGGPRIWHVLAGTTQVDVLGTRFRVERRSAEVLVTVARGKVRVSGPDVPGGIRQLQAGQSVRAQTPPPVVVDAAKILPPSAAVAEPASAPEAVTQPVGQPPRAAPQSPARDVDRILREADQARAQGQPERAAKLLKHLIAEHPKDKRAALAAFTLGELQLGPLATPLQAASTFERAQSLGLPAALAEQGAARIFEAYAAAKQPEQAAAAARAYLGKYPEGPHRRAAERHVGGQ